MGMGITPQHHFVPRMSPKPGTRCWGDTRPHSLGWSCHPQLQGELLAQDRARGRSYMEAHQIWLCLPTSGSRGFSMHWDRKVQAAPKGTWGGTEPPGWPCCSCPTRNPGIPPSLKIQEDPPQLPLAQQWVTGFTGFNILQLLN